MAKQLKVDIDYISDVHNRFCKALCSLLDEKKITLTEFADIDALNRVKYSIIINEYRKGVAPTRYVDTSAIIRLCTSYGINAEWLIRNVGKMTRT